KLSGILCPKIRSVKNESCPGCNACTSAGPGRRRSVPRIIRTGNTSPCSIIVFSPRACGFEYHAERRGQHYLLHQHRSCQPSRRKVGLRLEDRMDEEEFP